VLSPIRLLCRIHTAGRLGQAHDAPAVPCIESMKATTVTSPQPLRIAHIINEPFSLEGANGVQQVVYCLARALAEIGHSVAVFSREGGTHVLEDSAEVRPRTSATVLPARGTSLRQRFLAQYLEPNLVEDIRTWQPDILHFHSVHIPQNVALAAYLGRAGIPYCVTVHGGLFRAALRRGRVKKAVFNLFFERRYLNEARFIHAVSPHETQVIRRHGVDRPIVVVPNGLPPDANIRALQPDALYVENPWLRDRRVFMFIGRLDPWQKGLDLLIEGFAQACLRGAGLVLVGPDCRGSRRTMATLADRLGISSQVVFTGPAFGQDRADLFAAADVFVHPSRWEGLSLSVVAAAAEGKPCLITREADPLGELERAHAAILVEATVSSIAAGLSRAATLSGDELQLMGMRARCVVKAHLKWPSIAGRLVEAYRSALNELREPLRPSTGSHSPSDSSEIVADEAH
jgi:glycosyltransferase involved in cell wall biosynthesis